MSYKIAIVHDYLCSKGGSERVFEYICRAFPEADVYTLALNRKKTFPYFSTRKIGTTWMQPLVRSSRSFRWLFLFGAWTMQRLDFSKYDLVVSSSATTAKYLLAPSAKHICYCYIPTRAFWHFDAYFGNSGMAKVLRPFLPLLKKWDFAAAQKVDQFISISESSRGYIRQYYGRDSDMIYSPIDVSKCVFSSEKNDQYLIVSRLETWKRVDYAIEAFNQLGFALKVIGTGSQEAALKAKAGPNITFLGEVDDENLALEYSRCKAVIFTPFIEYGLIPLEANASGTPVIAYGKGGVLETMVEGKTALFFEEQSADSLIECVKRFETLAWDPYALKKHAMGWDCTEFIQKFRARVLELAKD